MIVECILENIHYFVSYITPLQHIEESLYLHCPLLVYSTYPIHSNQPPMEEDFYSSTNHAQDVNESWCMEMIFNWMCYSMHKQYIWMAPSRKHRHILCKYLSFMQLISIHVRKIDMLSLEPSSCFLGVPCVFSLLVNEKSTSYRQIFFELKQIAAERQKAFSPQVIVTDFESGVLPMIKNEVCDCCRYKRCNTLSFLLVSFIETLWVQLSFFLGSLQTHSKVWSSKTIRQRWMCTWSLQKAHVIGYDANGNRSCQLWWNSQWCSTTVRFATGRTTILFREKLAATRWLVECFEHQFSNQQCVRRWCWEKLLRKPYVFFLISGYHTRLNHRVSRNHPHIWRFIRSMQAEEKNVQRIVLQWSTGASKKENVRTTAKQKRIDTLYQRFNGDLINTSQLLNGLSQLVGNKL